MWIRTQAVLHLFGLSGLQDEATRQDVYAGHFEISSVDEHRFIGSLVNREGALDCRNNLIS
jgi:hypothetical protein